MLSEILDVYSAIPISHETRLLHDRECHPGTTPCVPKEQLELLSQFSAQDVCLNQLSST
jgi:hypothetical protein